MTPLANPTPCGSAPAPRLVEALRYAQRGWPVLPLHHENSGHCSCNNMQCPSPAKHPLVRKGSLDASVDPGTIWKWWSQNPLANIGIATGSKAKLVVIDIDPRHGGDLSWQQWIATNQVPQTLTALTGRQGLHLYFAYDKGDLKNRTNILPGIDIRGEGGYVVAPGSNHISGATYAWQSSELQPLAPLPGCVLNLLNSKPTRQSTPMPEGVIVTGERNSKLASIAGFLRKSGVDGASLTKTLQAINKAACVPPLEEAEVHKIASSISKYQMDEPQIAEWLPPIKLPEHNLRSLPLTSNYLPGPLKAWIEHTAERMQVPLDFIAAPAIVSLSSIIGRQLGVYPKRDDDWFVVPNLWGAAIARPGFHKSPAISEATKPLEILAHEEHIKYEAAAIIASAQQDILKAKIDGLKEQVKKTARKGNIHSTGDYKEHLEQVYRDLEAAKIFERRFKTNDATVEKLACLLNENPNGLLVLRDELSGWLNCMNKAGREGDRDFYLESWNGYGSFSVDRIGRGTIHVASLCLSVFGGIQPGKLDIYVRATLEGGKGDDGLLQRFQILVYPDVPKKWKNIDRKPNAEAFAAVAKAYKSLSQIKRPATGKGIPGVRFEKLAQATFDAWREGLENRLRGGGWVTQHSSPTWSSIDRLFRH